MDHAITTRQGVGTTASIFQSRKLRFSRVTAPAPVLIVVKAGRKELRAPGFECVLEAGDAVAIAKDSVLDITNTPDHAGRYEASWLVWDECLVSEFPIENSNAAIVDVARGFHAIPAAFSRTIDNAINTIRQNEQIPQAVAVHRVTEVLVWLDAFGARFDLTQSNSASAIVRRQVLSAPETSWTAPYLASTMAMSEATLRRRLNEEGTTVSALVADVRMSLAMQMLQSTQFSVARIALEVGYESASRFAMRFRDRFGFSPSAIRGHQRADEPM